MARRHALVPEPRELGCVRSWVMTLSAGLSLLGVVIAGKFTRDAVRNWDRYTLAFADIDCTLPPGKDRLDFLAEVQYLAGMPNRLSVLDEELASHLAAAFARHPWVEDVEKVIILPTHQVHVRLRFRNPAHPSAGANEGGLSSGDSP